MSGLKTISPTEKLDFERVDAEAGRGARGRSGTATLHEAGGKIGALPPQIKPMAPSFKVCGPAFTVQAPPGDNLWLHRALASRKAGRRAGRHRWAASTNTATGARSCRPPAKALKLGGLVIDGCVRDGALLEGDRLSGIRARPVHPGHGQGLRGATAGSTHPVLIGDITVNAGDLVVGDADGVCVVPRARVAEVIQKSLDREAKEAKTMEQLRAGATTLDLYGWNR